MQICVIDSIEIPMQGPFYSSIFELASVWVTKEHEPAYVRFLDGLFGAITRLLGVQAIVGSNHLEALANRGLRKTRTLHRLQSVWLL